MSAIAGCGGNAGRSTSAPGPPASVTPSATGASSTSTSGLAIPLTVDSSVLERTWHGYVAAFIQDDGRVVDHERDEMSTSEGQSYAMLRAVWAGDRDVFERAWRWARSNLATPEDGLFGYLWGRASDGGFRLLSRDSATDADTDIALALVLGSRRFGDSSLLDSARDVIAAIWQHEVATIAGAPVVSAGSWAPGASGDLIVNPSYFAPYAYRIFATIDTAHPWAQLAGSSYRILRDASSAPLSTGRSAGLPPNWCALDRGSGEVRTAPSMPKADVYGYDAFRTPWRVAVDVLWNGGGDGLSYLRGFGVLASDWKAHGDLAGEYGHDGTRQSGSEIAAIGAGIGALAALDPAAAQDAVQKLESSVAEHDGNALFGDPRNYYEQNWAWFGLALAAGAIRET